MTDFVFCRSCELLKLGYTKSIHTVNSDATKIRKKLGVKPYTKIPYQKVAEYFNLDPDFVFKRLNGG